MFENPDSEARCALLKQVKNIAVVGLSPNPARPSYGVSAALQKFGYRVIPVHPQAATILGEKVYRRLADIPGKIDLVDVFRQPQHVDEIIDQCIALGLKAVWLQDGVVNEPAAQRARAAGMTVIMDRCIYRDYVNECSPPR
jgi:predicted CoA-binding protein